MIKKPVTYTGLKLATCTALNIRVWKVFYQFWKDSLSLGLVMLECKDYW